MVNSAVQLDTSEFLNELLPCSGRPPCTGISITDIFSKLEDANDLTEVEIASRFVSQVSTQFLASFFTCIIDRRGIGRRGNTTLNYLSL